jgi:protein-arginine kinase activator protein McsA
MKELIEKLKSIRENAVMDLLEPNPELQSDEATILQSILDQLKTIEDQLTQPTEKPLKCEMCGRTGVSSSFFCPDCSWHHNPIP